MSPLPPELWHTVHMDFCGPFPTGEYLFVITDAYSQFPEVDIVYSTSASAIIPEYSSLMESHVWSGATIAHYLPVMKSTGTWMRMV